MTLCIYRCLLYLSLALLAPVFVLCYEPEDYCSFGLCKDNEYCCGYEECCAEVNVFFYLKVGSLVIIVICLMIFICLYNKCAVAKRIKKHWIQLCGRNSEQSPLVVSI